MSCLITVAGEARCWGSNWSGQLGVGDTNHRSIPTAVTGLAGLTVVDIAIGQWHVCFMYTDGVIAQHGVKCVGRNIVRMLGTGATTDPTLTPTDVVGLTSGVVEIEAGMWHSCAIMNDSTMKCWGNSGVGELGNGTNTRLEIAAAVPNLTGIQKMIIGDRHTCVVNTSQAMTCWGGNGDGQLGLGDTNNRNVPVALSTMTSGVTEVAAGGEDQNPGHTCALKDGSVYCWGSDASSQSALGYEPQSSIAVTIAGLSVPIPVVVPTPSPQVPVFIPPSSSTPPTVAPRPFDESMVIGAEPVTFSGLSSQLFSGQSVSFEASGFTPGAAVDVYLASTPRLLTTVTADVSGKVSVGFTVPGDLVGEHHVVLYEPESGRAVRQAVIIAPLTLPVTGPGESSTDLVVTIALFLLIFGVLGEKFARQRRFLHPEHQ
jgi:hypothetical protein